MTNSDKDSAGGKPEKRKGEDFVESTDKGGASKPPKVHKEETGATESGEEDKGAKM